MNNTEILEKISQDVAEIKTSLGIVQTGFLYFLGGIVAIFVCILLYKLISSFMSF